MDKLTTLLAACRRGPEECWPWPKQINWTPDRPPTSNGYARVCIAGKRLMAHRAIYELLVGPVPEGLQIDHLCRNPRCVNPAHLEPVTAQINLLRGDTLQARNAAKTHCANEHPFNAENTFTRADGSRGCRICNRRVQATYNRKRRAARHG